MSAPLRRAGLDFALSPEQFVADTTGGSYTYFFGQGVRVTGGAETCFQASLDLPDGATITAAHGRFYDAGALNVSADVERDEVQSEVVTVLASFPTTAASGRVTTSDTTVATPLVDRSTYVYLTTVCLNIGQQLNAVWIDYSMP